MTRLALAAILVLPLALTGCGDGGDAPPQSGPAKPPRVPLDRRPV